jgi:hypothetical protein
MGVTVHRVEGCSNILGGAINMEKDKESVRGRENPAGNFQRLCNDLTTRCQSCDYKFLREDKELKECPVCETHRELCEGWAIKGYNKCRHHKHNQGRPPKLINKLLKEDHRELVLRCIEENQTMRLREEYFALKELVYPQMLAQVGSVEDGTYNAKGAVEVVGVVEKLSNIQEKILKQETSQEVMDFYLSQEKLMEEFQRQLEISQRDTAIQVLKEVFLHIDPNGMMGLIDKLPAAMRMLWEEGVQMLVEAKEVNING